jgi:hypothetical protein
MSVHGMKPMFRDREGYLAWRREWRDLHNTLSEEKRRCKLKVKNLQRQFQTEGGDYRTSKAWDELSRLQAELVQQRVMGHKLMTVLAEAKLRRDKILAMHQSLAEQQAGFPLEIEESRNIDFHFNKISIEFPFMPMWTLKAKGKSYYLNHIDCEVPWTTRETPDNPSTKGSLRIKRGRISISEEGNATITL